MPNPQPLLTLELNLSMKSVRKQLKAKKVTYNFNLRGTSCRLSTISGISKNHLDLIN